MSTHWFFNNLCFISHFSWHFCIFLSPEERLPDFHYLIRVTFFSLFCLLLFRTLEARIKFDRYGVTIIPEHIVWYLSLTQPIVIESMKQDLNYIKLSMIEKCEMLSFLCLLINKIFPMVSAPPIAPFSLSLPLLFSFLSLLYFLSSPSHLNLLAPAPLSLPHCWLSWFCLIPLLPFSSSADSISASFLFYLFIFQLFTLLVYRSLSFLLFSLFIFHSLSMILSIAFLNMFHEQKKPIFRVRESCKYFSSLLFGVIANGIRCLFTIVCLCFNRHTNTDTHTHTHTQFSIIVCCIMNY